MGIAATASKAATVHIVFFIASPFRVVIVDETYSKHTPISVISVT
jgi:hypothetical protein